VYEIMKLQFKNQDFQEAATAADGAAAKGGGF
jgi:hypothetical protein